VHNAIQRFDLEFRGRQQREERAWLKRFEIGLSCHVMSRHHHTGFCLVASMLETLTRIEINEEGTYGFDWGQFYKGQASIFGQWVVRNIVRHLIY